MDIYLYGKELDNIGWKEFRHALHEISEQLRKEGDENGLVNKDLYSHSFVTIKLEEPTTGFYVSFVTRKMLWSYIVVCCEKLAARHTAREFGAILKHEKEGFVLAKVFLLFDYLDSVE